jgi:tetratricopeptide (TPR) repeat protein
MLRVDRFPLGILLLWFAISGFAFQRDATPADQDQDQSDSSAQQDAATNQDENQQDAPAKQDSSANREREAEMSSSKDTRIDLSPPADDAKKHPQNGAAVTDAEDDNADVQEFQKWDPHKAAKDIEVGDFYYKKKNYRAALERYKEALTYKPNDAVATYRLAECQDRTGNSSEAITHYHDYLKILPHGPFAADAQKALERLKADGQKESSAK